MWGLTKDDEIDKRFDDMIDRTIRGEIISAEEWEAIQADIDVLDQWNEGPESLTVEEAEAGRTAFGALLERLGLSLENRLQFCRDLLSQAQEHPSLELLQVFCMAVSGNDFLLGKELPCPIDEYLDEWGITKQNFEILYDHLAGRKAQTDRFLDALAKLRTHAPPRPSGVPKESTEQERIFQIYTEFFGIEDNQAVRERLLGNIAWLISVADSSETLTALKPLFLYRVLRQHGKRLKNRTDLHIDFCALWNYKDYKIDENNGKNYRTNSRYLDLFCQLYYLYEEDETVDLQLCICGFDHLSNLGEFYRTKVQTEPELPLGPSMERIMLNSVFTCWPYPQYLNPIQEDNGIRESQLAKFQKERKNRPTLNHLIDYADENIESLQAQFLECYQDVGRLKFFCEDFLEAAQLPEKQKPKTPQETALIFATLYDVMTLAVDLSAEDILLQTGCALIGDRYPH